jgi:hypothetical protein
MNLGKLCGFETMCFDLDSFGRGADKASNSSKTIHLKIQFEDGNQQELTVPVSADQNGQDTASIRISRLTNIRNLM